MSSFASAFAKAGLVNVNEVKQVKVTKRPKSTKKVEVKPEFNKKRVDETIEKLEELRRNGVKDWMPKFQEIFKPAYWELDAHKLSVLRQFEGQVIELTGNIIETRKGAWCKDDNMTRISPAYINGIRVQHVHISNTVLKKATITKNFETKFIRVKSGVYSYGRTDGSVGMSIGNKENGNRSHNNKKAHKNSK